MDESKFKPLAIIPVDLRRQQMIAGGKDPDAPEQKMFRVGEALFDKLAAIYSSPHFCTEDEKMKTIDFLVKTLKQGIPPELMITKMKQLADKTDFKTKVNNVIMGKYWERQIAPSVKYVPWDINKNL
jgi:hypothetical protein